jgi:Na+-translocating ferredoxin:NAD+ oxidoreductase RnfC subunit
MTLAECVRRAGVVGAGGGGFPTAIKLSARADMVLANGAECEPLLHKDAAILERSSDRVVAGDVASVQSAVDAAKGVLSEAGVLVNAVVIARPHPDVFREIV